MHTVKHLLLSVTAVLLCSQQALALVTGTVRDRDGSVITGAELTFTDETNPTRQYLATTDGSGRYELDFTDVAVEQETPAPFALGQNFPNPFNPATTIPFSLDAPGHVRLAIYNVTGQRIRTLIDSRMPPGMHAAFWDGRDDDGMPVSAGVYLYRLNAREQASAKKMLLLDSGGSGVSAAKPSGIGAAASTGETIEQITCTVRITQESIMPYEEAGVRIYDGQTLDFEVIRETDAVVPADLVMVNIPGGSFRLGDIAGVGEYDEQPIHTVRVSSFIMSVHEITQGQFEDIMGYNPVSSSFYGFGDDFPVYDVDWEDAVLFCNTLSDAAGLERCYDPITLECDFDKNGFRLPSEVEWEYACRAGTETIFYSGSDLSMNGSISADLEDVGWYNGNAFSRTHPVGGKEPNAFGLYDMHGNVWEWCNDYYNYTFYQGHVPDDSEGPGYGDLRVIRGGGFGSDALTCRAANRNGVADTYTLSDTGFRVVRRP